MSSLQLPVMLIIFTVTIILMLWRPKGINETIPTTFGAVLVLILGIVPVSDVFEIFQLVNGASLTILSTIMMSLVLESIGVFKWVALNLVSRSKGSGIRLFFLTNLLCFFMTMFFNNDGSILITTPIIVHIIFLLKLRPNQMFPYLISGALIATAASAPIAVSNISNLIALKIVGMTINEYITMMFVPSMIGIVVIAYSLYKYFRKDIPHRIPTIPIKWDESLAKYSFTHPLEQANTLQSYDWGMFKVAISIVILTRASFFALSPLGIPIEWIGLTGAFLLICIRWWRMNTSPFDIFKKTPWHILLFAFNMYVLVYGLKNVGFNDYLISNLRDFISDNSFYASFIMGTLLTILSNLFNNLPAVMIGTLSLLDMGLENHILQIAYLANVIGSDIGSLLTPVGTLATLIWMFMLKKYSIHITWAQYLKVTIMVIPLGLIVSLLSLYLWVSWISL